MFKMTFLVENDSRNSEKNPSIPLGEQFVSRFTHFVLSFQEPTEDYRVPGKYIDSFLFMRNLF